MGVSKYNVEFKFYYDTMSTTLPVPPSNLTVDRASSVDLTENVMGETKSKTVTTGLRRFSIDSFFPNVGITGSKGQFLPVSTSKIFKNMGNNAPVSFPENYIEFFNLIQANRATVELRIVGLAGIDTLRVNIEHFSYTYKAGTNDLDFSLSLVESNPMTTSTIIKKPSATSPPVSNTGTNNKFAIGDKVRLTGKYFYTSYGGKPSYTFKNGFIGRVHKIKTDNRPYPIHISQTAGTAQKYWIGWVKRNQIIEVIK